mgnify:CR=1 FL=1
MGRRVLRFDSHFVAEGCGIALRAMSFIIPLRGMENRTTGLRPMEMHPFGCCAPLPPEGEVCSPLSFRPHKHLDAYHLSPSGGKVVPKVPKGMHFPRAIGAVVWFFLCYCQICKLPPLSSTHSPTTKWGEGGGASHQRGAAFTMGRRLGWLIFLRAKPGLKVLSILAPKAPTLTLTA